MKPLRWKDSGHLLDSDRLSTLVQWPSSHGGEATSQQPQGRSYDTLLLLLEAPARGGHCLGRTQPVEMAVLTSDHAADKSLWSWGISEAQTQRLWVAIGFWVPAFLILRSRLPKGSDCCLDAGGGKGAEIALG